ncbi:MAG: cation diffusion facilitator family transporter [Pseudomonadota bacterium]
MAQTHGHRGLHDDHHHELQSGSLARVLIALVLTGSFMVVEVIGGILSGSLALLADAGHMFTDTIALGLAAVAFYVSRRPANERLSYGYQRLQILAAFVNGLSLLLIVGWILFEALQRLLNPQAVVGETMLLVASAGFVVNLICFAVLNSGDRENLNIRGAALHVAGDLLGSMAAIVAAIVILYTGWMPIDPILSVAVAMLILRSAWTLVRRSAHILLEGAPEWFDSAAMGANLVRRIDGLSSIHHVHVWGLTQQQLLLTMHVILDGSRESADVVREIKVRLRDDYGIAHSTVEIEFDRCADDRRGQS